ncbi:coiled-coil protein [Tasmannia lanceolata]|uniref:coiled-coil protein n=1 Tax=Tasmannia lanceolata TaxID=3420 RepID=UPI004062B2A5
MSFLPGRLASTEGAYFLQESKHAVGRLAQKIPSPSKSVSNPNSKTTIIRGEEEGQADVLPEVLRHSIPFTALKPPTDSSLSTSSKWLLDRASSSHSSSVSYDAVNPLRAFVSLPQVTFGPKRWQLPNEDHSIIASTANDLRLDRHTTSIDPEKMKDAAAGFSRIAMAFVFATTIVFGGATVVLAVISSKLQLRNIDDIRTKGRDMLQPRSEMIREQLIPLRGWAENMSRKCRFEGEEGTKEKLAIVKELSKRFGPRTSN